MRLFILVLLLASLACGVSIIGSETPSQSNPSPAPPPSGWHSYTVIGTVNIRSCPNTSCPSLGTLKRGDTVKAKCSESWCEIKNGYVWAACLGVGGGKCTSK